MIVTARAGERIDELVARAKDRPATWNDVRDVMRANVDFKLEYEGLERVNVPDAPLNYIPVAPRAEVAAARDAFSARAPFSEEGRTFSLSAIDGSRADDEQSISQELDYRLLCRSGKRFLRPDFGLGLESFLERLDIPAEVIESRVREKLAGSDAYTLEDIDVTFAQGDLRVVIRAEESDL